ncbi:universal stress protein [Mycolicibacterium sp. 120266]|uniref:universal stress protein n=1 Tax=Mycolicibacterium sp. 120266 TaxID=3090601 RepID=UPI00299DB75E|nr:universal stress protein [Mycolicibacterium sp. 120266]MDX1875154.1 universal stress protein [Mycolicibacterium sp. 120266]
MTDQPTPVVVGVDGSITSLHAARWAGALAARLGAPLQIVHAKPYAAHNLTDAMAAVRAAYIDVQQEAAPRILEAAAGRVRHAYPDLEVTTTSSTDPVEETLLALSRHARLLVLGGDDIAPASALLVGSLTLEMTTRAECPVVAWRGETLHPTTQPIVVGVDGSSCAALVHAFELADVLGAPLRVVHAWSTRMPPGEVSIPFLIDWEALETLQHEELARAVEPHRRLHPDVEVSLVVDPSKPRRALLQRLDDAQLVVVGARGRNTVAATVLGSTSLNMLHHSPVPVLVCGPKSNDR